MSVSIQFPVGAPTSASDVRELLARCKVKPHSVKHHHAQWGHYYRATGATWSDYAATEELEPVLYAFDGDIAPKLSLVEVWESQEKVEMYGDSLVASRAGCVVLVTRQLTAWDVDMPLGSWDIESPQDLYEPDSLLLKTVDEIERTMYWPKNSLRVYRTSGGFRVLSEIAISPRKYDYWRTTVTLRGDAKYLMFCLMDDSYRLRLTPKPWRNDGIERVCQWLPRDGQSVVSSNATIAWHDVVTEADGPCRPLYPFV